MIITVSREIGAGGAEVAARVARALGWRLVDDEMIDRVAVRAGMPREEVAEREERAPGFLERLVRMASRAAPELFPSPAVTVPDPEAEEARLVQATEAAVEELAAEGRIVLVGRAAPAVLGRDGDTLHVKIVAPRPIRVEAVARRLGVSLEEAEHRVAAADANRRRYHQQHYRRDWNDAANYHLVLNTAALGVDAVAETIVARARARWR
jgi:cytidylate kinase